MHQMDTILVAVGVPTKEGAGATPGHSQSVILSEMKIDAPEAQPITENGHKENPIKRSNKSENTDIKNEFTETEGKEHSSGREPGNGWDIPDISDLLDLLSDSESEQKDCTGTESIKDLNHQGLQEGQSDTDSECMSWEWDTKHWSNEPIITHHPKKTECPMQGQVTKSQQPFSATLPTLSLHSPVTEHTATALIDSDEVED